MCAYVAQSLAVCRILVCAWLWIRIRIMHTHAQAPALGACNMHIHPLADHVVLAIPF